MAEFDDILIERDAISQLNELDRLVGEAKARKQGVENERKEHAGGNDEMEEDEKEGNVPYEIFSWFGQFGRNITNLWL